MNVFRSLLLIPTLAAIACPVFAEPKADLRTKQTLGLTLFETEVGRVTVNRVAPGSPAEAAGLRSGDVILEANERAVVSSAKLGSLLNSSPTENVALLVKRGDKQLRISLGATAGDRPAATPSSPGEEANAFGMFLIEDAKGKIIVSKAAPESPADSAGLKKEDVIVGIDEFKPSSLEDLVTHLHKLVQAATPGREIPLHIVRNGERQTCGVVLSYGMRSPVSAGLSPALAVARVLPTDPAELPGAVLFVSFQQEGESLQVRVQGSGLKPGKYELVLHEYGDVGDIGKESAGPAFPPTTRDATAEDATSSLVCSLEAKEDGAVLNQSTTGLRLSGTNSILGRALVLHAGSGDGGPAIAGGVVGVGNPKRAEPTENRRPTTARSAVPQ